jgi:ABC-type glutathione transport system ATPase component
VTGPTPGAGEPLLVLEDVVKIYRLSARLAALWGKPTRVVALEGVTLTVRAGEIVGLTGPSGGGKSTLAAIAAGRLRPTRGRVRRPPSVAYLPQDPDAGADPSRTVSQLLGEARDATAFADAGLPSVERFLDRPIGTLSGGERQRVGLGHALALRPALLVVDEPLSLVDVPTRLAVLARLRRRLVQTGGALLYVTHDRAALAALAGRVVTLADGRVVQDAPPPEPSPAGGT